MTAVGVWNIVLSRFAGAFTSACIGIHRTLSVEEFPYENEFLSLTNSKYVGDLYIGIYVLIKGIYITLRVFYDYFCQ